MYTLKLGSGGLVVLVFLFPPLAVEIDPIWLINRRLKLGWNHQLDYNSDRFWLDLFQACDMRQCLLVFDLCAKFMAFYDVKPIRIRLGFEGTK